MTRPRAPGQPPQLPPAHAARLDGPGARFSLTVTAGLFDLE